MPPPRKTRVCGGLSVYIAKALQLLLILTPAGIYLNKETQIDPLLEEELHLLARLYAHLFDKRSLGPNYYAALRSSDSSASL